MIEEENINEDQGEAIPDENGSQPDTGNQPGAGGSAEQNATKAIEYIYADSKTFASLMEMLKASQSDPTTGIAQAAVMIIGKLESDVGELPTDEISAAGVAVVMALLDLANKAGILPEVTKEIGAEAWGKAIKLFMKKHPGRIDPAHLQQIAQQGAPQQGGAQSEQAVAPVQPQPETEGLLR